MAVNSPTFCLCLSPILGYSEVPMTGGKGYEAEYPDCTADYASVLTEGIVNGSDHPDFGYLLFDPQCESVLDANASEKQPMSEETLRASLKKLLEFCFSRLVAKNYSDSIFFLYYTFRLFREKHQYLMNYRGMFFICFQWCFGCLQREPF